MAPTRRNGGVDGSSSVGSRPPRVSSRFQTRERPCAATLNRWRGKLRCSADARRRDCRTIARKAGAFAQASKTRREAVKIEGRAIAQENTNCSAYYV